MFWVLDEELKGEIRH